MLEGTKIISEYLGCQEQNLTLLLIKYKYYNCCFFSSDLILLPKLFVTKGKEVTGGWRKLQNE